jgi:hypothetical protein
VDPREASAHWLSIGERAWYVETVWAAARDRPVEPVALDTVRELDEDCWFRGGRATVRDVVEHARMINAADLDIPIILAADGQVLDGMHRVAKAALDGRPTVPGQRLLVDPEPDWLVEERT